VIGLRISELHAYGRSRAGAPSDRNKLIYYVKDGKFAPGLHIFTSTGVRP
jgi:hypothetical protein